MNSHRMPGAMYTFHCPQCGVELAAPVADEHITNDTELNFRCIRAREPAGCGEWIAVRPSQGVRVK
jgi:hypothetical protein